jgi:hypothetical protein
MRRDMEYADLPKARQQKVALSPFQKDFAEYLDPKISELVLRMVHAGQFVLYSCEGHGLTKPRYVTLAFASETHRSQFVHNVYTKIGRNRVSFLLRQTLSTEIIAGKEYVYETPESEVKGINHLYKQNHKQYCFAIMRIGKSLNVDVPDHRLSLIKQTVFGLKNIYYAFYNFKYRDQITLQLTSLW